MTLGSASFSIPAGRTATVEVKLSSAGLSLVSKHKKLTATAAVAAHDKLGRRKTTSAKLTLKPGK